MKNTTYTLGDGLYLNITNKCPCDCVFCLRKNCEFVGDAENLWLEKEPDLADVITELEKRTLSDFKEIVFCGFGEPTENFGVLLGVCRWLKEKTSVPIRLNTNGLADLINKKDVAVDLKGLVDVVSISLNAPDARAYFEIVRPVFGEKSFGAMLAFAENCKKYVPEVVFSVVDVIGEENIEKCRQLANNLGITLRIRLAVSG